MNIQYKISNAQIINGYLISTESVVQILPSEKCSSISEENGTIHTLLRQ